jgi:hypothetical protein
MGSHIKFLGTELILPRGVRKAPHIKSAAVHAQNAKLRTAAIECKGRKKAEFRQCMSAKM